MKSEIIKGTGRFEGIKGTQSGKMKYLPPEKGEPGMKGYGEGTPHLHFACKVIFEIKDKRGKAQV